jgi:hypothetical protein
MGMFYGLYGGKGLARFMLTRADVLGDDDLSTWLTTDKVKAEEMTGLLKDRYDSLSVVQANVFADLPWMRRMPLEM